MLAKLRALLAMEPALVAWALNGGLASVAAFLLHFTKTQEAALVTIVTALAALYSAFRARPVSVSALTGALATIATAAAAFGLHLSPGIIATGVTVLSAVLGLIFRSNLTPKAALGKAAAKKG